MSFRALMPRSRRRNRNNSRNKPMTITTSAPLWHSIAALVGRIIFAGIFIMAAGFKFMGMNDTAAYLAAAGFPLSVFLAWVAAIFESALAICFLAGAFFSEASLLAAVYVVFLAFSFHGPSYWSGNQA